MITNRFCIVSPFPPPFAGMSVLAKTLKSSLESQGVIVKIVNTNATVPSIISKVHLSYVYQFNCYLLNLYKIFNCNTVIIVSSSGGSFYFKTVPTLFVSRILRRKVVLIFVGGSILTIFNRLNIFLLKLFKNILVATKIFKVVFNENGIKCDVFPHIVEVARFTSVKKPSCVNKLLSVKTLDKYSSIDDLIRVYSIVKDKYLNTTLTIIGDGPEKFNLQNLVKELHLTDVYFTGNIPYAEMPKYYSESTILIHGTKFESFGIALVEAMAAGTPIVSTNVGGIPEVIDHGITGLLVEHGDYLDMATKVISLLSDKKLYNTIANNGIVKANTYSPGNLSVELLNYMNKIE